MDPVCKNCDKELGEERWNNWSDEFCSAACLQSDQEYWADMKGGQDRDDRYDEERGRG